MLAKYSILRASSRVRGLGVYLGKGLEEGTFLTRELARRLQIHLPNFREIKCARKLVRIRYKIFCGNRR